MRAPGDHGTIFRRAPVRAQAGEICVCRPIIEKSNLGALAAASPDVSRGLLARPPPRRRHAPATSDYEGR